MTNLFDAQKTRREALATTLGGAAVVSLVATAAEAKIAQSAVAYQGSPHGAQRCDNCKLWQAPNACKNVSGAIAPSGWCRIWVKA
ncbi:MAG: high-potential iron-sulfur protein [Hyphomicrobiales bacterium]|nr:high-potential iron-sulfur protein [Hyphomicrobiales bacterium]